MVLEELHVSGLGVIEDATLELAPGLNVLSGETGAGKTMITVGLALALGARASSGVVRAGHRAAAAEARFRIDPSALRDWGVAGEDQVDSDGGPGEVVLARTLPADGRGSAR